MNTGLRAWIASHREIRWATAVAVLCALLVGTALFWPAPSPQQADSNEAAPVRMRVQAPPQQPSVNIPAQPVVAATEDPVAEQQPAPRSAAAPLPITKPVTQPVTKAAPPPAKKSVASAPAPTTAGLSRGFFVQVGSFRDKSHAEALKKRLENHHWPVRIQLKKGSLHAVWVGGYASKAEAEKIKTQLASQEKLAGFITVL